MVSQFKLLKEELLLLSQWLLLGIIGIYMFSLVIIRFTWVSSEGKVKWKYL